MLTNNSTIINAIDLGKCYKIYNKPNERLKQAFWRGRKKFYRDFWALRNISFEIKPGESLGIIGRNGSGKSTLLQLICGTLTPTEGNLNTRGRIAALLELGSGFNPEFTGLENVYLNASLMGLSKEETNARLEGILAFADIGDFISQPVKTYSSGMTVRLAFAVIAHVNADILVVDEALAVGDAIFVQRCMRFIRRMREEKCLLFVSHDAEAVKSLCTHALWLHEGSIHAFGKCKTVTLEYLSYCQAISYGEDVTVKALKNRNEDVREQKIITVENGFASPNFNMKHINYKVIANTTANLTNGNGWKTGDAELLEVSIMPVISLESNRILKGGEEVEVKILAKTYKTLEKPILGFVLRDRLGQTLFGENTLITENKGKLKKASPGNELTAVFRLWFPMLPSGEYTLLASIADGDLTTNVQHHWVEDAVIVTVSTSNVRYGLVGVFITHASLSIVKL